MKLTDRLISFLWVLFLPMVLVTLFTIIVVPVLAIGPRNLSDRPDWAGKRATPGASLLYREDPTGGRLRSCQARQGAITKRSQNTVKTAQNMEMVFTNIASRVEGFYLAKLVPAGKTVSNYDTLVADVSLKKDAVDAALPAVQDDATNFSCDNVDPKGEVNLFRTDMQKVIVALKDYRTSVRNLILGVRGVTPVTFNAENGTETASGSGEKTEQPENPESTGSGEVNNE